MNQQTVRLDCIKTGQKVKISKLHAKGKLLQKFLDMGFINSVEVEIIREAPLYDPMQLKLHNYHISVRKSEAQLIEVEKAE